MPTTKRMPKPRTADSTPVMNRKRKAARIAHGGTRTGAGRPIAGGSATAPQSFTIPQHLIEKLELEADTANVSKSKLIAALIEAM